MDKSYTGTSSATSSHCADQAQRLDLEERVNHRVCLQSSKHLGEHSRLHYLQAARQFARRRARAQARLLRGKPCVDRVAARCMGWVALGCLVALCNQRRPLIRLRSRYRRTGQ